MHIYASKNLTKKTCLYKLRHMFFNYKLSVHTSLIRPSLFLFNTLPPPPLSFWYLHLSQISISFPLYPYCNQKGKVYLSVSVI